MNNEEQFIPPTLPQTSPSKPKRPISLIIVIILLLLASIGLGSGLYLQMMQASDLRTQVDDLKAAAKGGEVQVKEDEADTSGEYREIPELGVKYKVSEGLENLTYAFSSNEQATTRSIGFSTIELSGVKEVSSNVATYPCVSGNGPAGGITRHEDGSVLLQSGVRVDESAKKIGEYFYVYTKPQYACGGSAVDESTLQATIKLVETAFNSLEKL